MPSSAIRLGTLYVEDLLGKPGSANILGEVAPPPMRYCELYTVIAPADDDVINLTDVATEELEGKSAMLAVIPSSSPRSDGLSVLLEFTARAHCSSSFTGGSSSSNLEFLLLPCFFELTW